MHYLGYTLSMKVWSVQEVAVYLKVAPITIYRKAKAKEIPFFKVGRHLKFSQETIEAWVQGQAKQTLPSASSQPDIIQKMVDKIVSAIHPQKIILFGSYAWGTPTKDSDIDLCVIHPTVIKKNKRARIIRDILYPYHHPLDVLVYTPEEVEEWEDVEGSFLKKILDQGKIVYDETRH